MEDECAHGFYVGLWVGGNIPVPHLIAGVIDLLEDSTGQAGCRRPDHPSPGGDDYEFVPYFRKCCRTASHRHRTSGRGGFPERIVFPALGGVDFLDVALAYLDDVAVEIDDERLAAMPIGDGARRECRCAGAEIESVAGCRGDVRRKCGTGRIRAPALGGIAGGWHCASAGRGAKTGGGAVVISVIWGGKRGGRGKVAEQCSRDCNGDGGIGTKWSGFAGFHGSFSGWCGFVGLWVGNDNGGGVKQKQKPDLQHLEHSTYQPRSLVLHPLLSIRQAGESASPERVKGGRRFFTRIAVPFSQTSTTSISRWISM